MEELVIFYMSVHDFSVEIFLKDLANAEKESPDKITIRLSSNGGSVESGWGMVAGFRDFKDRFNGDVMVKVDGIAASWAAIFLLFVEGAEAIKQSRFLLHRASFPSFVEVTDEKMEQLKDINKEIKQAFVQRINIDKFEKIAGVSVNRFFDSEKERIDVNLTAKQAKSIGLIKNVINLNPVEIKALNNSLIAASAETIEAEIPEEKIETEKTMTFEEFKTKHPEEYNKIVASSTEEGKKDEMNRVKAWMEFSEIDSEASAKGIKDGTEMTVADMAAFQATAIKTGFVANAKKDNAGNTPNEDKSTDNPEAKEDIDKGGDGAESKLKDFQAEVEGNLGIGEKQKN